jgi:hypothetical protein
LDFLPGSERVKKIKHLFVYFWVKKMQKFIYLLILTVVNRFLVAEISYNYADWSLSLKVQNIFFSNKKMVCEENFGFRPSRIDSMFKKRDFCKIWVAEA